MQRAVPRQRSGPRTVSPVWARLRAFAALLRAGQSPRRYSHSGIRVLISGVSLPGWFFFSMFTSKNGRGHLTQPPAECGCTRNAVSAPLWAACAGRQVRAPVRAVSARPKGQCRRGLEGNPAVRFFCWIKAGGRLAQRRHQRGGEKLHRILPGQVPGIEADGVLNKLAPAGSASRR